MGSRCGGREPIFACPLPDFTSNQVDFLTVYNYGFQRFFDIIEMRIIYTDTIIYLGSKSRLECSLVVSLDYSQVQDGFLGKGGIWKN